MRYTVFLPKKKNFTGILVHSQVVWVYMVQLTWAFLHAAILLFNFSLCVVVVIPAVVADVVVVTGIHMGRMRNGIHVVDRDLVKTKNVQVICKINYTQGKNLIRQHIRKSHIHFYIRLPCAQFDLRLHLANRSDASVRSKHLMCVF